MSDYLDPANKELLKDFFEEAVLQVESLEQNILVLEENPDNKEAIDEIFRAAHTLKGGSATVEMSELAGFTHLVENLLDEIRDGKIEVDESCIDLLLASIDTIKKMLKTRMDGGVFKEDIDDIKQSINGLLGVEFKEEKSGPSKSSGTKKTGTDKAKEPVKDKKPEDLSEYDLLELKNVISEEGPVYRIRVSFNKENIMNTVGGIQVYALLKEIGNVIKTIPEFEALYKDNFYPVVDYFLITDEKPNKIIQMCDITDVTLSVNVSLFEDAKKGKSAAGKTKQEEDRKDKTRRVKSQNKDYGINEITKIGSVLRVDSRRIDNLMNLVSEAVINKATFNQINTVFNDILVNLQEAESKFSIKLKDLFKALPEILDKFNTSKKDAKVLNKDLMDQYGDLFEVFPQFESALKNAVVKFRSTAQNLGRNTNELQEGVMKIRMVPVSQIFSRFPRLVRDLSRDLKKNVRLVTEGEDTELDKSVIEDLLDPLIHCVRNSLDHGIEPPDERAKLGKTLEGNILLKAYNEGNVIIIEVNDDGKGIDIEAVQAKAIKNKVIHPDKKLSELEAFNLIFEPGFSTAQKVTNVSGRGVGLDVVRKKIEKLNGSVSVWSEKGKGTKIIIRLPLTLAIIQGLLVKVSQETYAIPITSVIESLRIKLDEIKFIDNYEVFNLRDDVLSLIRLNNLFNLASEKEKPYYYIVVVGAGDNKVGLMVDSLIGEEDVVIKPLKDKFSNSPGIAGATILGDGTVALIIDVGKLLELSFRQEITKKQEREARIV
ncbi:MAG: chemotaxis protein CheA [Spirochaetales bacterium]|nr:chemotaxis protein CheA [Spirochaetales bacterium]